MEQSDIGGRRKGAQFAGAMGHQALDGFGVELTRHEHEPPVYAADRWPWRNELRHVRSGRRLKQVTHFHPLGLEISGVVRIRLAANRHLLDHLNAITLEPDDLLRVVR